MRVCLCLCVCARATDNEQNFIYQFARNTKNRGSILDFQSSIDLTIQLPGAEKKRKLFSVARFIHFLHSYRVSTLNHQSNDMIYLFIHRVIVYYDEKKNTRSVLTHDKMQLTPMLLSVYFY